MSSIQVSFQGSVYLSFFFNFFQDLQKMLTGCFKFLYILKQKALIYSYLGLPWWFTGKDFTFSVRGVGLIPGQGAKLP